MNFFNTGARVEKHKTGFSSVEAVREGVGLSAREAYAKYAINERSKKEQAQYNKIEKDYARREQTSAVIEASLKEGKVLKSTNDAYREGKELLFKEVMFEAFYQCLYLDDDFKEMTKESLYTAVAEYIDNRGGFKLLEQAIATTNSAFLKSVKQLCESTARKVCSRKMKEDTGAIDFSLNAEEEKEFNYAKNNLGIEELSELVKQKVLTVVKDEKNREKQENELLQNLADEANKTVEEVEEAFQNAAFGGSGVEESTLFNSIFRDSYAQYLTEGCKKRSVKESDEDDAWDADTEDFEIDMDVILAETITKYTLMEMSYTVQLETFTPVQLRRMVQNMLNK